MEASENEAAKDPRVTVARRIRSRAQDYEVRATYALGALVTAVLLGGLIIYAAGGLFRNDVSAAGQRAIKQASDQVQRAHVMESELHDMMGDMKIFAAQDGGVELLEQKKLIERSESIFIELADAVADLNRSTKRALDEQGPSPQTVILAGVGIRVAIMALLFFFVQILFAIHRYNARMAAHCHACADAIELSDLRDASALQLLTVLAPNSIEFGKAPKPPTEQIAGVLRDAAEKRG